jgi:RHS repeat-associated protein
MTGIKARLTLLLAAALTTAMVSGPSPSLIGTAGIVASEMIGGTEGTFSVDGNGTATYDMPIEVPPGTNGVEPKLAFTYSGQRDNGIMGMGWAVSGIDSVSRCNATPVPNGFIAPVAFNSNDRFCIGSSALIATKGTYGADNTEYRTVRDTWTRFVSHGTCGAGPCSFSAQNKDGSTLSFGGTTGDTGSRILASERTDGAVRVWSLDRFTDHDGNSTAVSYVNTPSIGEYYPKRIDYTSNVRTGLAPQRAVVFEYERRNDPVSGFTGGSVYQTLNRLTNVKTYVSGQIVKNYAVSYTYGTATARSRVASIQECATETPSPDRCLPATVFTSSDPAIGLDRRQVLDTGQNFDSTRGLIPMDVNGDGRTDLVQAADKGNVTVTTYRGTPAGLGPGTTQNLGVSYSSLGIFGADVNADGRGDLVMPVDSGGQLRLLVFLSQGTSFGGAITTNTGRSARQLQIAASDVNGDGREDVIQTVEDSGKVTLVTFLSKGDGTFEPPRVTASSRSSSNLGFINIDVNGDGRTDVVQPQAGAGTVRFLVYYSNGGGFDLGPSVETGLPADPKPEIEGGDFDGDSKADLLLIEKGSSKITMTPFLSTGAGFEQVVSLRTDAKDSLGIFTCNLNDDGRTDLLQELDSGGTIRFLPFLSTGGTFRAGAAISTPQATGDGLQFLDITGDGKQDVVVPRKEGSNLQLGVLFNMPDQPDLVTNIANGIGGTTAITLQPLTVGDIYTLGSAAAYPVRDVATSMPVVASYTNADGRGASYRYTYKYERARVGMNGIGWLGFGAIRMIDAFDGRLSLVRYDQTWPSNGIVLSTEMLTPQSVTIGKTTSEYRDISSADLQRLNIHQIARTADEYTSFDADGARLYTLRKTYDYDVFGNVSMIGDLGRPLVPGEQRYDCVRYKDDPALWRFGFAAQEKLTRTAESCRAFLSSPSPAWDPATDIRWIKRDYDDRMNLASDAIYDDSHASFLTTTYTYDDYGNILTETAPANAQTAYTYDDVYKSFVTSTTTPPNASGVRLTSRFITDPFFGRVTQTTDANGNVSRWNVDGFGRIVDGFSTSPANVVVRVAHLGWGRDANGTFVQSSSRPTWDAPDDPTAWRWSKEYFDGLNRQYRTEIRGNTPEATVVGETVFNALGQVEKSSGPHFINMAPAWTTHTYDIFNRPVTTTRPDGTVEKLSYELGTLQYDRTAAFGTPDAQTIAEQFNVFGLITSRIMPNGQIIRYTYSGAGNLASILTLPDRRTMTFTYDSVGRLRTMSATNTGTTRYDFDAQGFMTGSTDASGNSSVYVHDRLNRIIRTTLRTAAGEQVIDSTYDGDTSNGRGNLTRVATSKAPLGAITFDFGYDANSDTKSVRLSAGGNTYSYGMDYNPSGELANQFFPDGAQGITTYGLNGLISTIALKAGSGPAETYVSYPEYTASGSPLTVHYKNGVDTRRGYYPADAGTGKLKSITAQSGARALYSREFLWNRLDIITGIVDQLAHPGNSETFAYDKKNMGFLVDANGSYGKKNYTYDAQGNRKSINEVPYSYQPGTDRVSAFGPGTGATWNADGTLQSITRDGQTLKFSYTAEQRVDKVERDGASPAQYVYDFAGNLLYEQRLGQTTKTTWASTSYEIDDLGGGRIIHTKYLDGMLGRTVAITTDGATTLTAAAIDRNNYAMRARLYEESPRLARRAGALIDRTHAFLSDPALAARTAAAAWLLLFAFSLLAAFLILAALRRHTATAYALQHVRFAAIAPIVVAAFTLFAALPVNGDLAPGENGAGVPVLGTAYFVQDQIGDTASVTDERGDPVALVEYLPFGGIDSPNSMGKDSFRPKFTGKDYDAQIGLYHFGEREYDPHLGRFSSADPAAQYVNPYLYAGNSPASFVDPNGEFAFLIAIVIGAVIGAYMGAAAVNHDYNPANWDWKSGKTYAGLFGGAVIGAVGGVILEVAASAGIVAGIAGAVLVGAGENAAYTAMGGGSWKDILISAGEGAAFGLLLGGVGAGLGRLAARFGRRAAGAIEGAAEGAGAGESRALRAVSESCASFPAGQEVVTEGGSLQPVETLTVHQKVRAFDQETQRGGSFEILATMTNESRSITRITTESGTVIEATPNHLMYVWSMGWMRADTIRPPFALTNIDGNPVPVRSVETRELAADERVYNISVDRAGDYYVSSDRVLVKNVLGACLRQMGTKRPHWWKATIENAFEAQKTPTGLIKSAVSNETYPRVFKINVGTKGRKISIWALDHITPYKYLLEAAEQSKEVVTWKDMIRISNHQQNTRYLTMMENSSHGFEQAAEIARPESRRILTIFNKWRE